MKKNLIAMENCIEKFLEEYDTKVTALDLKYGNEDEFGVVYSLDGKRLLQSRNYKLKHYEVKPGTEVICDNAFSFVTIGGCPPPFYCLHEIQLPESVRVIGDQAFLNTHLSKINLPERLLRVGSKAFFYTSIAPVKLPDSLRYIGDFAFGVIFGLKEIRIPAGVTTMGVAPFCNCFDLERIEVSEDNTHFTVDGGILFDHDKTRLIQCPCKKTQHFDIPDTAIYCDRGAFCRDTYMDEIPEVTKMKWRLQRMQEIWLEMVERPCGIRKFFFPEIGCVVSVKLSNSMYCNIKPDYKDGYPIYKIDADNEMMTLLNALGFVKLDLTKALGMVEEVVPRRNKYKCYLHRALAKTVSYKWMEDYVDEDTGETCSFERNSMIGGEGYKLDREDLEFMWSYDRAEQFFPLLLYKDESDCHLDWYTYHAVLKYQDEFQEKALYLLDKKISHLRLLYFLEHKDYLLHAFTKLLRLSPDIDEEMENAPEPSDDCPSSFLTWIAMLMEFFEKEMTRITPAGFSYKQVFQDFAKGNSNDKFWRKDFAASFSFLFANARDCFDDGPFP